MLEPRASFVQPSDLALHIMFSNKEMRVWNSNKYSRQDI